MKLLMVFRRLLRQGKLRILLLLVVSLYSGYMVVAQAQPLLRIHTAAQLWNRETMSDCLLLDYRGKAPSESYGYNSSWPDTLHQLQSLEGVRSLYTSIRLQMDARVGNTWVAPQCYAVSGEWLRKCQIPLSSGRWEEYDPAVGYIPVLMSYSLRPWFHLGDVVEFRCVPAFQRADSEKDEGVESSQVTLKVVGFLPVSDAVPNFTSATVIVEGNVYGITADWYNQSESQLMLIPQEALAQDPNAELMQYSIETFMAIQLEEELVQDETKLLAFRQMISRRGIGETFTTSEVVERVRSSVTYRQSSAIGIATLMLFLALELFSIITFQSAFIYERRRMLGTLHLMGVPWRSIGGGWMLLCVMSSVLPVFVGMCLGTWISCNHMVFLPQSAWLYLMPVGMVVLFGATICGSLSRFARMDAILLLHEE